ncbi:MAG: serine/threonine protein kinase [Planctomycetes bacterium]|nr:serine/threonine protein kinase [Planctomycetota bacterium]
MNASVWVPGGRVGEYRLLEQLGAGAMGAVWRAEHLPTGALRALKTTLADAGEARERFAREARALAELEHPHVTRVHTAGEAQGRQYLVMDLAPGGDLADRLKAGPLEPEQARLLVRDLARGLEHVHWRGLLHRDLKPSNVLFADDGRPMLVDFGLARRIDGSSLTQTGAVLGTPSHMSPEQAEGAKQVDERTDVYGLGAVLYHALAGRPPFTGSSLLAVLRAVIGEAPEPPSRFNPRVPPGLEAVCLKALAKDPAQRYPSARALGAALDAPGDAVSRRPVKALGVGVLTACVALGVAYALRSGEPPAPLDELHDREPLRAAPAGPGPAALPSPEPPQATAPALPALERFMASFAPPDPEELEGTLYGERLYARTGDGVALNAARDFLLARGKPRRAAAWIYHVAQGPREGLFQVGWRELGEFLKREEYREALWGEERWSEEGGVVVLECYLRGAEAGLALPMLSAAKVYLNPQSYPGVAGDPREGLRWLRAAQAADKTSTVQAEVALQLASLAVEYPETPGRPGDAEALALIQGYLEGGPPTGTVGVAQALEAKLEARLASPRRE